MKLLSKLLLYFCIVLILSNPVSAGYMIKSNGYYVCDAQSKKIYLTEQEDAEKVTYNEVIKFLEKNKADQKEYRYPEYTCANFAKSLHNAAERKGIKCGCVTLDIEDNDFAHIFNLFSTTDRGDVYVDCSQGDDYIVLIENEYCNLTSIEDGTVHYSIPANGGTYEFFRDTSE